MSNFKHTVKPERNHFRCEEISTFHREMGYNYPAVDLDFVLLEFDNAIPMALIEHKYIKAKPALDTKGYMAMSILATRGQIPFFEVRYNIPITALKVTPINPLAKQILDRVYYYSPNGYKKFLNKLRNNI